MGVVIMGIKKYLLCRGISWSDILHYGGLEAINFPLIDLFYILWFDSCHKDTQAAIVFIMRNNSYDLHEDKAATNCKPQFWHLYKDNACSIKQFSFLSYLAVYGSRIGIYLEKYQPGVILRLMS